MVVVLTSCTNRKSVTPREPLRAANLPSGTIRDVAAVWKRRSDSAGSRIEARRLYCGRGFREAESAAAEAGAGLFILSAGFGIVRGSAALPSYSLSIAPGADCILDRLTGSASAADWWNEGLGSVRADHRLAAVAGPSTPVLLACGGTYLGMIAAEFEALPNEQKRAFRIFTRAPTRTVAAGLRDYLMPYDSRLDGPDSPLRGTLSDFAQRALRDFVRSVLIEAPGASIEDHRERVLSRLSGWRLVARVRGVSRSDEELVAIIRRNRASGAPTRSAMLRFLRDELGVACEQKRFQRLFDTALEGAAP